MWILLVRGSKVSSDNILTTRVDLIQWRRRKIFGAVSRGFSESGEREVNIIIITKRPNKINIECSNPEDTNTPGTIGQLKEEVEYRVHIMSEAFDILVSFTDYVHNKI